MVQIVITSVSGSTAYPISVYISDIYGNNQSLIGSINNTVPPFVNYNSTVPEIFSTADEVMITLEDNNGCKVFKIIPCLSTEILIITQDKIVIMTQDGDSLTLQTLPFSYEVSLGSVTCPLTATLTQTLYSPSPTWESVVRFFLDNQFTVPYNGNNLNYSNSTFCGPCWVIDSDGYTSNFNSPC